MRTGKKKISRGIDIGSCYEALEPILSKSALGFDAFTKCDQIGWLSEKSNSIWWDVFDNSDDTTAHASLKLRVEENLPSLDTLKALEKYFVKGCG